MINGPWRKGHLIAAALFSPWWEKMSGVRKTQVYAYAVDHSWSHSVWFSLLPVVQGASRFHDRLRVQRKAPLHVSRLNQLGTTFFFFLCCDRLGTSLFTEQVKIDIHTALLFRPFTFKYRSTANFK
jgi:hypothetical protein